MLDLAILLLLNSLLCFGFWNACLYEQTHEKVFTSTTMPDYHYKVNKGVLWFIEKWSRDKWFHKPLCGCLPCMASLHSIYPYLTYVLLSDNSVLDYVLIYPIYVLALSGLNYLIDRE